jgi:hypothetical protein
MKSIADIVVLSEKEKLSQLKKAKGGTWYDGWVPYCIVMIDGKYTDCSSPRMKPMPYGFKCPDCGNMIGYDLIRLIESPLNKLTYK